VGVAGSGAPRCACGSGLLQFWIWPDEERDDLMHVTDRWRDVPKHAEQIRAVSATDAAIAYDRKHEPEHDVHGPTGQLRKGRCARRLGLRS
jgi:hypothetical protein